MQQVLEGLWEYTFAPVEISKGAYSFFRVLEKGEVYWSSTDEFGVWRRATRQSQVVTFAVGSFYPFTISEEIATLGGNFRLKRSKWSGRFAQDTKREHVIPASIPVNLERDTALRELTPEVASHIPMERIRDSLSYIRQAYARRGDFYGLERDIRPSDPVIRGAESLLIQFLL